MTTVVWFTLDLRLNNHPALQAAASKGEIVPVFILDRKDPWHATGAGCWWLHHSLSSLTQSIADMGGQLILREGDTLEHLQNIVQKTQADAVYFSRAHEPWLSDLQTKIYNHFCKVPSPTVSCKRFAGRMLLEPDSVLNKQGKPFQVFTPFYKHASTLLTNVKLQELKGAQFYQGKVKSDQLKKWQLLPTKPNWAAGFSEFWQAGEQAAKDSLELALDEVVSNYDATRDSPQKSGTSRLSPHLHFGELSPRQVWVDTHTHFGKNKAVAEPFLRQLFWREFGLYLLHHWPKTVKAPFKEKFAHFPWQKNAKALRAWQQGKTGYPIVDAGMRELWHTGWMHNRVRMVAASFLTKHLMVHWHHGANWFWDTLLDADLANNTMGWQWVAGCGADAAPYFRIFNPVLQGEKFDPNGDYVKRWVPELAKLERKYIHSPWQAPAPVLKQADVMLGKNYPNPIVDHSTARSMALEAYGEIK